MCTDQAPVTSKKSSISSKEICWWILKWETTGDGLLHWRKGYYGFTLKTSWWICSLQTYCFSLQMIIDGLEWCGLLVYYCDVFISCLNSHSDGIHSLQRIHWWASNAEFLQICSDKETNSSISWTARWWTNIQHIFMFWVNCSINGDYALFRGLVKFNYKLISVLFFSISCGRSACNYSHKCTFHSAAACNAGWPVPTIPTSADSTRLRWSANADRTISGTAICTRTPTLISRGP